MFKFIYNKKYVEYITEETVNGKMCTEKFELTTKDKKEALRIVKNYTKDFIPIITLYEIKTYFCKINIKTLLFIRIENLEHEPH